MKSSPAVSERKGRRRRRLEQAAIRGGHALIHGVRGSHGGQREIKSAGAARAQEPGRKHEGCFRLARAGDILDDEKLRPIAEMQAEHGLLQRTGGMAGGQEAVRGFKRFRRRW